MPKYFYFKNQKYEKKQLCSQTENPKMEIRALCSEPKIHFFFFPKVKWQIKNGHFKNVQKRFAQNSLGNGILCFF